MPPRKWPPYENDAGPYENDAGPYENDAGAYENDAGSVFIGPYENDAGGNDWEYKFLNFLLCKGPNQKKIAKFKGEVWWFKGEVWWSDKMVYIPKFHIFRCRHLNHRGSCSWGHYFLSNFFAFFRFNNNFFQKWIKYFWLFL